MRHSFNIRLLLLLFLFGPLGLSAQGFYDVDHVPQIEIEFAEANWDEILDSLYVEGDEERLLCTVTIDGTRFEQAAIRYKGFSSVSTNRVKNPFNISLDEAVAGQEYQGINKIKLSNVIQDPSFVREVLSYEIARKYMPASQANFAKVFVNGNYHGLYTNVEAVNKDFLGSRFASRDLNYFKCNPASLNFSGENSDLSNVHGSDTTDYYPFYELKSDHGWTQLYHLIDTLNTHPEAIEALLNVDRTLWMHAFNYTLINFDSYVGYGQNYYLYQDQSGCWNPIIWDLNMSFGSFRFTDASDNFAGFTIDQAKTIDPLQHHNSISVYPRPLMRMLFANPTYRRMYLAHMRTIMQENIANNDFYLRGTAMQALIDADVAADVNKFYTYADFQENLDTTVSDLIAYPGIKDLMDGRNTYLQSYPGYAGAPTILTAVGYPSELRIGETACIQVTTTGADSVIIAYRNTGDVAFKKAPMLDDGLTCDNLANDGTFGIFINDVGYEMEYYVYAENDSAGIFFPERTSSEFLKIHAQVVPGMVHINEIMAFNKQTQADSAGEFDNWIELYNATDFPININSLAILDGITPLSRYFTSQIIEPGGYQVVWMDGDFDQGPVHIGGELSPEGGELTLTNLLGDTLEQVNYPKANFVTSYGRLPNGTGPFVEMIPTFSTPNRVANEEFLNATFYAFPNPANNEVFLKTQGPSPAFLQITTADGKIISSLRNLPQANGVVAVNTEQLAPGLYFFRIYQNDVPETIKVIISH